MTFVKPLKFQVVLDGMEGSSVAALSAPFDVQEVFGTRGRVPVRGTINGFPFRSSLMPMGGCHRMVVNKAMREGAGVKAGDRVQIVLERDTEDRVVIMPATLKTHVSKDKKALANWEKLSYTHKKEIARWVTAAKREETREQRLEKTAIILKTGAKWSG